VKKVWEGLKKHKIRLFFAFYLSFWIHISFLIYTFNSTAQGEFPLFCGPDRLFVTEEETEESFVFSLEMGEGDGEGNSENPGDEGKGEGDSDFSGDGGPGTNPYFDSGKFKDGRWEELVQSLEESSQLRKNFKNSWDQVDLDGSVAESYIRRERDYEDITVKEVFPTLKSIDRPFSEDILEAPDELVLHQERNKIIEQFRNPEYESDVLSLSIEKSGERPARPPLKMEKDERSKYLDKNLPLKKEVQWKDFVSRYLNYDPNSGNLPDFIRELYYENLQRLAYSFSKDPTYLFIDYFQENLNKEDFLKESMALYSANRDNKTGTELLFAVENIYEIQARALGYYFQSRDILPGLSPESKKELRVEVIRRVVEKYRPLLREKKIQSINDVNRLYTQKRIEILDELIATTPKGYRSKDAYFEKGKVYWQASQMVPPDERAELVSKALSEWRKIDLQPEEGDFLNEDVYKKIRKSISSLSSGERSGRALSFNEEMEIQSALQQKLFQSLEKKKNRESDLLWKRTPKPKSGGQVGNFGDQ
jgi:hypothetical protein